MERVSEGPTHRFAGVGNVLVCVYWGEPPVQALRDRVPWIERTLATHAFMGLLVVVTADATGRLPEGSFRDESRRQGHRFGDRLGFSATVIEGSGIQHSLIRTFLRGLSVVAAPKAEARFFETLREGAAWASERCGPGGPSAERLAEAVDALRP